MSRDRSDTALSPFTLKVLEALREAHPEPLSEKAIAAKVGTRWVRRHIETLNKTKGIKLGYDLVKGEPHHCIVIGAERTAGNQSETAGQSSNADGGAATAMPAGTGRSRKAPVSPGDAGLITRASTDGSLSAGMARPERSPGASDDGRSAVSPEAADSSSGAPEGQLFELPPLAHFDVKAEAA